MASSVFQRLCFAVFFLAAVGVFASFEHQHGDLPLFAPRVQPCVSRESLPSGTLHLAGTDHVSSRVDRSFCGGRLQPARRPPSFLVGRRSRRLLLPGSGEHRLQGESCSRDEARFFDAHRAGGRLDCLGHHSTASLGTRQGRRNGGAILCRLQHRLYRALLLCKARGARTPQAIEAAGHAGLDLQPAKTPRASLDSVRRPRLGKRSGRADDPVARHRRTGFG